MIQKMKPLKMRSNQPYTITLHAFNRGDGETPRWEMWCTGATNVRPVLFGQKFAQPPSQAISHKVACEKEIWRLNHGAKFMDYRTSRPAICKYRLNFVIEA